MRGRDRQPETPCQLDKFRLRRRNRSQEPAETGGGEMLLGVIADDFTGAGDIANTLAKGLPGEGGLDTVQLLGVPDDAARIDAEAAVIALKSRSVAPSEAVGQSLQALRWLRSQGCRQVVFKYCSTFDSTPRGNIGPVGEALAEALGAVGVVACPAFPAAGRTVYQGHLFVHDRLLSESGLESHPLNPMTDPDIRALARPAGDGTGRARRLAGGQARFREDRRCAGRGGGARRAAGDRRCADRGRPGRHRQGRGGRPAGHRRLGDRARPCRTISSPGAWRSPVPSGRRWASTAPRRSWRAAVRRRRLPRSAVHAERHPTLEVDVERVLDGSLGADELAAFLRVNAGRAPLVFSSASPEKVKALQHRFGREHVAARLDRLFAETARQLVGRRAEAAGRRGRRDLRRRGFGPRSRPSRHRPARSIRACRCWCRAARGRLPWR